MENNDIPTNAPEEPKVEAVVEETVSTIETPVTTEPKALETPKKKNSGMLLGMICLAILAIAGIAFGVWTMMDKDQQVKSLNDQITSLKSQNNDLQSQIEALQATTDNSADFHEILPPKWGEAEAIVQDNKFTILNADGEVFTQYDEYVVSEIVSCESGTPEAPAPLTCVVATPEGQATIIYNFDEQSLEYVTTAE